MRLNIDCIRDIMLWAEEITTPTRFATYLDVDLVEKTKFIYQDEFNLPKPNELQLKLLGSHKNEVLVYHLNYCINAGLLIQFDSGVTNSITISDLTPLGHEFLGNIRHKNIFDKTKTTINKVGVETLPAIMQVASSLTSELIKSAIFNTKWI